MAGSSNPKRVTVCRFAIDNWHLIRQQARKIYDCDPMDLSFVDFEDLATETLIELYTVDPVMGGPSVADQREHILAELEEPSQPAVRQKDGDGDRQRLMREARHPDTSPQRRAQIMQRLKDTRREPSA